MALNIGIPKVVNHQMDDDDIDTTDHILNRIAVVGVGGPGVNAICTILNGNLLKIPCFACDTDKQSLLKLPKPIRFQLGINTLEGLGTGSSPEKGREAALEQMDDLLERLDNCLMVILVSGMGGGTGTGASVAIAEACKNKGMSVVAFATTPFKNEGQQRHRRAKESLFELEKFTDALITIPNQNLLQIADDKKNCIDDLQRIHEILLVGLRAMLDIIIKQGVVNSDFNDLRKALSGLGKAMISVGEADGDNRAMTAVENALYNPLLEDLSIRSATHVLCCIFFNEMTMREQDAIYERISNECDPELDIKWGTIKDPTVKGIRLVFIASGMSASSEEDKNRIRTTAKSLVNVPKLVAVSTTNLANENERSQQLPLQAEEDSDAKEAANEAANEAVTVARTAPAPATAATNGRGTSHEQVPFASRTPSSLMGAPRNTGTVNTAHASLSKKTLNIRSTGPQPQRHTATAESAERQSIPAQGNRARAVKMTSSLTDSISGMVNPTGANAAAQPKYEQAEPMETPEYDAESQQYALDEAKRLQHDERVRKLSIPQPNENEKKKSFRNWLFR